MPASDKLIEEVSEPYSMTVERAGKPEDIVKCSEINSPFPDLQSEFSFWRSQDGRHFLQIWI
jgi:hypothetical protein